MSGRPEIIEMPEPLGLYAGQLFDRATEYFEAFRVLAPRDLELMHAKYFLLAHALELYLKSFLASNGVKKTELRETKKFGHNLPNILSKCVEFNIPTIENLDIFVREIHHKNEDFDFRYPSNYNLRVPSPDLCMSVLEPLHKNLRPIIEKTRVRAQIEWAQDTRHLKGKNVDFH
ncbi:hypothetical protein [Neorhizobium alkalisoli]|uniref:HEPN domain-containing protein n=1 Tax=Neorhizobium alkalisoli TaxID=528178 RepID=A0A561R3Z3_9HYPH|nr:hypothetical protein [Neorhizobium alkalisoli]TWF57366.1 hypothetical protein FHW37_1021010 [Neorhizobium alkalisoli]